MITITNKDLFFSLVRINPYIKYEILFDYLRYKVFQSEIKKIDGEYVLWMWYKKHNKNNDSYIDTNRGYFTLSSLYKGDTTKILISESELKLSNFFNNRYNYLYLELFFSDL
jgi:hypothetical protein